MSFEISGWDKLGKVVIVGNVVVLDLILTNYSAEQVTDEMIEVLVKMRDLLKRHPRCQVVRH